MYDTDPLTRARRARNEKAALAMEKEEIEVQLREEKTDTEPLPQQPASIMRDSRQDSAEPIPDKSTGMRPMKPYAGVASPVVHKDQDL